MNVSHRDGKTFVEVEIPKGEHCGDCFMSYSRFLVQRCKAIDSEPSLIEIEDDDFEKHKDCPSLKEGEKV